MLTYDISGRMASCVTKYVLIAMEKIRLEGCKGYLAYKETTCISHCLPDNTLSWSLYRLETSLKAAENAVGKNTFFYVEVFPKEPQF